MRPLEDVETGVTTNGALVIRAEDGEAAVREAVLEGLRSYNREHADPPNFQPLLLSARNEGGELIGGLVAQTGWEWLHVELLWVSAGARRQGVGRQLLRCAEALAKERGCRAVYLDTFDFQARPFYEKEGYKVFGVQEDYPPGHQRFYLRKSLSHDQSTS